MATALKIVGYITSAIEHLVARGGGEMGSGGGQSVIARDQHDPAGPLAACRISRTYRRTAHSLQVLRLRDELGHEQTLHVTEEHPFHLAAGGDAWVPAKSLAAGDTILGGDGTLSVVSNEPEAHPAGVTVYNLEVEDAHTYFVLAADAPADAEAVWVHNASYNTTLKERIASTPAGQFGDATQAARGSWSGARGRSTFIPAFIPENAEILAQLEARGMKGVPYRMGMPVFGELAEGTINTTRMTADRRINFAIADELLGNQWGWSAKKVASYRSAAGLTWHEMNNMRTMQLVPTAANSFFDHLGGIGELKRGGL